MGQSVQAIDNFVSDARLQGTQPCISPAGGKLRVQRKQHTAIGGHIKFFKRQINRKSIQSL